MKRNLKKAMWMIVACFCCAFLLGKVQVHASVEEEVEDYELGETCKGVVSGSEYYKFVVNETSYITIETKANRPCAIYIYDTSFEKEIINDNDLLWKSNEATGIYKGGFSRKISSGTYYVKVNSYYSNVSYSFNIQSEKIIKLPEGDISVLKSSHKGQMTVKSKSVQNAVGYRIQYSEKDNFKNKKTVYVPGTSKTFKGLKKGQVYYVKVCPYAVYDNGTRVFGKNSQIKKVRIKK